MVAEAVDSASVLVAVAVSSAMVVELTKAVSVDSAAFSGVVEAVSPSAAAVVVSFAAI